MLDLIILSQFNSGFLTGNFGWYTESERKGNQAPHAFCTAQISDFQTRPTNGNAHGFPKETSSDMAFADLCGDILPCQ